MFHRARYQIVKSIRKMSATILSSVLLLFATTGYTRYSGSCYKPHRERATWNEANTLCNFEGGYLVEINDAAELQVVMAIRPDTSVWTWIGLRKGPDGEWRTVLGTPFNSVYNEWAEDRYNRNNSYCGFLRLNGKLDALKCNLNAEPFLCEKS